jgi:hypothetical protein
VTLDLSFKQRLSVFGILSAAVLAFLNSWDPPAQSRLQRWVPPQDLSVFIETDYAVPLFLLIPVSLGWVGLAAESRAGLITCIALSLIIALTFWWYYDLMSMAGVYS